MKALVARLVADLKPEIPLLHVHQVFLHVGAHISLAVECVQYSYEANIISLESAHRTIKPRNYRRQIWNHNIEYE